LRFFSLLSSPLLLPKLTVVRSDDAQILKDGIDALSPVEVEEAAISRGFSPANSHTDQKQYLQEWIRLSQANVPPYLLLLSRYNSLSLSLFAHLLFDLSFVFLTGLSEHTIL
jgi:LETM1-like protein